MAQRGRIPGTNGQPNTPLTADLSRALRRAANGEPTVHRTSRRHVGPAKNGGSIVTPFPLPSSRHPDVIGGSDRHHRSGPGPGKRQRAVSTEQRRVAPERASGGCGDRAESETTPPRHPAGVPSAPRQPPPLSTVPVANATAAPAPPAPIPPPPVVTRQERAKGSPVWKFFIDNGPRKAPTCLHCTKLVGPNCKSANTTNMAAHLRIHHQIIAHEVVDEVASGMKSTLLRRSTVSQAEQWRLDRSVAMTSIACQWALRTCETVPFRFMAGQLNPGYKPCSTKVLIRKHIHGMGESLREKISDVAFRDGSFAITFDAWKAGAAKGSSNRRSYIGIHVATINASFNREENAIAVRRVKGKHTAAHIQQAVEDVLREYRIPLDSVVSFATDNHNTEVKVVRDLGFEFKHVRCFCHTLKLAVDDACKEVCAGCQFFAHFIFLVRCAQLHCVRCVCRTPPSRRLSTLAIPS